LRIFLDDIRNPPDGNDWMVFRSAEDLIHWMMYEYDSGEIISEISLDHDLGENRLTGYDFVKWLEQNVFAHTLPMPEMISAHSANPVGRENIRRAVESMRRFA